MNQRNNLLAYCLERLGCPHAFQKRMNVCQTYVKMFPLLLGRSRPTLAEGFFSLNLNGCSATKVPTRLSSSEVDLLKKGLEDNPYYAKYMKKIKDLELSDPDEFQRRMKHLRDLQSQKTAENDNGSDPASHFSSHSENAEKKQRISQTHTEDKGLDGILKLDKIRHLSGDEIGSIWIQHYAQKDAVSAVVPEKSFQTIRTAATLYPLFVYPVPRKDGYEMFVGQFADKSFHFTSLINYQRHGENAPSQLSLRHYTEMQDEKGIVLMSGLVLDSGVSVTDAQLLSYLVQYFYTEHVLLVRHFNQAPASFDVNAVISAMESGLLARQGSS